MDKIIDALVTPQSSYTTKAPLELGNIFERHQPANSDLVNATFASRLLDTTRRGVPAAVAESVNDRVISPKSAKKS
jgi:hypothetical protein